MAHRAATRYDGAVMRRLAVVAAAVVALACAGRVRPARARVDPSRRDEVMARTARELRAHGFAIAEADAKAGLFRTAWIERKDRVPCGEVLCPYRDRVLVQIAPDATVSVTLERQIRIATALPGAGATWAVPPPRSGKALDGVEAAQAELLSAIVE